MEQKYNLKIPGVKRLMREAAELKEPTEEYFATPLEDNLFEWHFTIRGPPSTEFDGGLYHGRILLPTEYPMKPPNIIILTPNGRFELNKKICLSISGYHPENWQPSWSIRTAMLALIALMPTEGRGSIGSLDYSKEERIYLAKKSQSWACNICGKISEHLLKCDPKNEPNELTESEASQIRDICFTFEDEIKTSLEEKSEPSSDVQEENKPNEHQSLRIVNNNHRLNNFMIIFLLTIISLLLFRRFVEL